MLLFLGIASNSTEDGISLSFQRRPDGRVGRVHGAQPDGKLTEEWGYGKLTALLRERLSEAEITKLAAEGAVWSEDQAVEEALKV